MKKSKFWLGKVLYTLFFIVLQAGAFVIIFRFFSNLFPYFYGVGIIVSLLVTIHILNSGINPAYKVAWIIPILLLPIFGGLLYLLFGKYYMTEKRKRSWLSIQRDVAVVLADDGAAHSSLAKASPSAALHAQYILTATGMPPYEHTETEYFPLGEELFAAMLRELEKAKSFIFLEYFIIAEGEMWGSILEILERKVREGVDVRVMYDDFGCFFTLPRNYYKTLRAKGISACVFNPFNAIFSPRFNNRDHRKICVIDGTVGFTGGVNLTDEYINVYQKLGHWKDSGIMLRGQAVRSLTALFLSIWDFACGTDSDFSRFAPDLAWCASVQSAGFVQPYCDIPLDNELVGENVYLNIINRAEKYVYITTPYLIIDNETMSSLCTAAKSGVDIRIITPHVPDKKTVFFLTRSYYEPLLRAGVRIYEYTPGFIHSKTMVSDDDYGVVGTINLDYRSLYLHVECAVWLHGTPSVGDVKLDFLKTLEVCEEVTPSGAGKLPWLKRQWLGLLRAFAPLV